MISGGCTQPLTEPVAGPTTPSGVNQTSEIRKVTPSFTIVPAKSSWQLSPGGRNFSAEWIKVINPAAGNLGLPGPSEASDRINFLFPVI